MVTCQTLVFAMMIVLIYASLSARATQSLVEHNYLGLGMSVLIYLLFPSRTIQYTEVVSFRLGHLKVGHSESHFC